MVIKINGKEENFKEGLSLAELVASKKLCVEKIVIEHNLRIVPKEEWRDIIVNENDALEIVSFVGGG